MLAPHHKHGRTRITRSQGMFGARDLLASPCMHACMTRTQIVPSRAKRAACLGAHDSSSSSNGAVHPDSDWLAARPHWATKCVCVAQGHSGHGQGCYTSCTWGALLAHATNWVGSASGLTMSFHTVCYSLMQGLLTTACKHDGPETCLGWCQKL